MFIYNEVIYKLKFIIYIFAKVMLNNNFTLMVQNACAIKYGT